MQPIVRQRPLTAPAGELAGISCDRCRKRKIKCDRQNPCSKCSKAKVQCSFPGGGERSRPASKRYVQALESQIGSMSSFLQELITTNDAARKEMLTNVAPSLIQGQLPRAQPPTGEAVPKTPPAAITPESGPKSGTLILAKAQEGRMRKLPTRKATQFYGGSSLFQLQLFEPSSPALTIVNDPSNGSPSDSINSIANGTPHSSDNYTLPPSAKSATCRELMAAFFQNVYQYNMCIYREYFLRDYDAGDGPYYSDTLMYSICAVGALISPDPRLRELSPVFTKRAEAMVYNSLDLPDLTILQSLIVLGYLEVGQGRSSKGWLFCGMAFRLTHEMGLHLDPTRWSNSKSESSVDREVLRRVYWAAFIADKQLSLFFGRPPALYPHESDVQNTIRIPYPPEWERLLDLYIAKDTSSTAFEDGISTIGSFVHQLELAKIFHTMIVDVFQNRLRQHDAAAAAATALKVHTSLVRWLAMLPQKLHWNQWTVDQVPPYVLHLHMLFHTGMIILHRPPRQHLDDEMVASSEDVEVCYQSLSAIMRLLSSYGRYYRFEVLPLDFVHTLSAAADVVMMRRYLEKSSWDEKDISKPLKQILNTMEAIQDVYPCMREIKDNIMGSIPTDNSSNDAQRQEHGIELDLMDFLQSKAGLLPCDWFFDEAQTSSNADLGVLVTDEYLNQHQAWNSIME
ncbi:fungal-specific transcription factor domain-containing protein [Ilyonectria destructans]|nr:fungal-specific transcription factor domain-containing protein [Ilyonectria destructans]